MYRCRRAPAFYILKGSIPTQVFCLLASRLLRKCWCVVFVGADQLLVDLAPPLNQTSDLFYKITSTSVQKDITSSFIPLDISVKLTLLAYQLLSYGQICVM